MYEYAEIAIAPISPGQFRRQEDRCRAVGAANDTDSTRFGWTEAKGQRDTVSPENTQLAAAPISISFGFEINAEKSVIAPIPRKIRGGYTPWSTHQSIG
jgi:hypothetical protein